MCTNEQCGRCQTLRYVHNLRVWDRSDLAICAQSLQLFLHLLQACLRTLIRWIDLSHLLRACFCTPGCLASQVAASHNHQARQPARDAQPNNQPGKQARQANQASASQPAKPGIYTTWYRDKLKCAKELIAEASFCEARQKC